MTDQRSPQAQLYRNWYKTRRWQAKRKAQLTKQPLCAMCLKAGAFTPATVADHHVPHKGDERLFWEGELRSLCALHHNSAKQREEKRGYSGEADSDGWPIDPRHPSNAA